MEKAQETRVLVSYRLSRLVIEDLKIEARKENRSITNMLETIIIRYMEAQRKQSAAA